jgi:D-alanyl-lipoteichoic acid acyltransferase DltB (MBOAT superfamily)
MLFNSYFFILAFLPATLGIFFWVGGQGKRRIAMTWLVAASLFFYGWWNPAYLGLILASMFFNYGLGIALGSGRSRKISKKQLLALGVTLNLGLLGYYKYANFFVANWNALSGCDWQIGEIVLPLGISFFTFTQIAFLVDAYRGEARDYNFMHYALFVTYFPHLIAGPVLHHKEMMPQFGKASIYRFNLSHFAAGLAYFIIGLFKKVGIADGVAGFASPVFSAAAHATPLTALDAWGGALAYTFQLYYDFSGYSDMAIGLAMMMGIRLPLNFDSPYKAVNIIDFWRRWHITLSRFLRDYIYIPLGGNRKGPARRYLNLFITMLLGGFWHGAGWTFIVWGCLHGAYLAINHLWHDLRRRLGHDLAQSSWQGRALGRLITFLAVLVGWVFFRAADFGSAERILAAMIGFRGFELSDFYAAVVSQSDAAQWLELIRGVRVPNHYLLCGILACLFFMAFTLPNTQQLLSQDYLALDNKPCPPVVAAQWHWKPTAGWAAILAVLGVWALLGLSSVSEFLYFQF